MHGHMNVKHVLVGNDLVHKDTSPFTTYKCLIVCTWIYMKRWSSAHMTLKCNRQLLILLLNMPNVAHLWKENLQNCESHPWQVTWHSSPYTKRQHM
jgi:hypothetical protein